MMPYSCFYCKDVISFDDNSTMLRCVNCGMYYKLKFNKKKLIAEYKELTFIVTLDIR